MKKVEKLETKLEELQYERDSKFFNDSKKELEDKEELETLRELIKIRDEKGESASFLTIAKNPYKYYKNKSKQEKRERQLYRKQLLLSKKQKAKMGIG